MRVFVAGATGVIGRRAVAQLVAAGHEVAGVARSPQAAQRLRAIGVRPVLVDLFRPDELRPALAGYEAVCNLATHIPPLRAALRRSAWATNDRLRREGARNLAAAAVAGGAGRFVQESVAFLYAPAGSGWIDEDGALNPVGPLASAAAAEATAAGCTQAGGAGVVLRFAALYAPESDTTRAIVAAVRRHLSPLPGAPGDYLSMLHADDAATAVVAALGAPAGTWNVVEDEPLTRAAGLRVLADALEVGRLLAPPPAVTRLLGPAAAALAGSRRVLNGRFRQATGWTPRFPSLREGWPDVLRAM